MVSKVSLTMLSEDSPIFQTQISRVPFDLGPSNILAPKATQAPSLEMMQMNLSPTS